MCFHFDGNLHIGGTLPCTFCGMDSLECKMRTLDYEMSVVFEYFKMCSF